MSSRIHIVVPLVFAAAALSPAEARSPVPAPQLLTSSPEEVRVRVPFDAPERAEWATDERTYPHLVWAGISEEGAPGDPSLPVFRVRVAVPPHGELSLYYDTEPRGRAGGIRFPPVPSEKEPDRFPVSREERRPIEISVEGPAYRAAVAAPLAEILAVGIERGVRIATVGVRPVSWNPVSGEATWFSAVEFSLTVDGATDVRAGAARMARPDRAADVFFARSLVNPAEAAAFRAAAAAAVPQPLPGGLPAEWFDDAAGWAKIDVSANGLYALDRQALLDAGVPVTTLDPRTLRVFCGPLVPEVGWASLGWDSLACSDAKVISHKVHVYDKPEFTSGFVGPGSTGDEVFGQVAVWVRGEADGVFDASDEVVFYGLGPDNYRDRFGLALDTEEDYLANPYTDHTVYWLSWGGTFAEPPLRMDTVNAAPSGGTVVDRGTARIHAEENTFYDPSMYQGGLRWEEWFWDFLDSDSNARYFFVDLPHLVPGETLDTKIRLWGARVPVRGDGGDAALHHVRIHVNGVLAGLYSWGGISPEVSLVAQDVEVTGLPAAERSEFRFRVMDVPSLDPNRYDVVHLTWIDVRYPKYLDLDGRPGELEVDGGTAGRTIRLTSPPSGSLQVFDVTDFRRPRRLTGVQVSQGAAEFAMDRTGSVVVAAGADGTFQTPVKIAVDTAPGGGSGWLRGTSDPADYLIIARDDLVPAAGILADWRRNHLYPFTPVRQANVRVVRISDVMDEFAWGMWDPSAVRYFLEYAYQYYGAITDDRLSYVLFLGDTTYDPRDHLETGVKDEVPSWEDNRDVINAIGNGNVQFVSDDPLARFDDPDSAGCPDELTDLYLGRITAKSPAEAQALVEEKVIRAEASPDYGPWRMKAILVADDICQGLTRDLLNWAHMSQMEQVADLLPEVFDLQKIYLYDYGNDCIYATKPEAKQDLLASWSEGAWLVNYVGHGADVVWADEHVLDLSDTPLLTNTGRLPLVGSFSCSVGKFSNPSRDGLGESHLRSLNGGSLVSAAATHLTSSFANSRFNKEFLTQLFAEGPTAPIPIGVALMHAKRNLSTASTHKYVCLGDPASLISVPREVLELEGPPSLARGTLTSLRSTVPRGLSRNGTFDVVARDARVLKDTNDKGDPIVVPYLLEGAVLYRGRTDVRSDSAVVQFTVPASLRGGDDGRIRAYAWGSDWDAGATLAPLSVGGLVTANQDTLGPLISFSVLSGTVAPDEEIQVTLEDPSGINLTQLFEFRSILLKVNDRDGLEQFREDLTPRFAYDNGSHTRGGLGFNVPDLEPAPYTFTLSATDNFNNRSQASIDVEVGRLSGAVEFEDVVGAYPNPFNPEAGPTRLLFSLSRETEITMRVYTVSGRLVYKETVHGNPGRNAIPWDGRDRGLDPVANGVYLVQLSTRGTESGDTRRHLERVVVLR